MCFPSTNWDMLGMALSARLVINALRGFNEGAELHENTMEAIEIISETRLILRYLNGLDKYDNLPHPYLKHFERYGEMAKLNEVLHDMQWDTWNTDLEQWLANKEIVKKFFLRLESAARHHHNSWDCF